MNTIRTYIIILLVALSASFLLSCGDGEKERIEGIKEKIALQYNADLRIFRDEEKGLVLESTQVFDIANRPSEGHKVIGVRIGDKEINHKVIGATEYEYIEEADSVRIILGPGQEFLPNQAGRFKLRLTDGKVLSGKPSGIFRRKLTFEPTRVWALVEDKEIPEGFTAIELNEPDLGFISLRTTTAFGTKQPPGGSRAPDKRSMVYSYPADLVELGPLTFSYFPSRSGYYIGTAVMWVLSRLAWMVVGIVLYVWWRRERERRAKRIAAEKARPKMKRPEPKVPPPSGREGGKPQQP